MTSQPATLQAFTDAAADAVARAIAGLQREAKREQELRAAEHRARMAELDARIVSVAELERRVAERLASLKDGEPGKSLTVEDVAPLIRAEVDRAAEGLGQLIPTAVRDAVAAIPPAEPGKSVDPDEVRQMVAEAVAAIPPAQNGKDADPAVITEMVERAVAALPPAQPGKDADPAQVAALVDETVRAAVAALPPPAKGDPGPMGSLPEVREWKDGVHYQGNVVTHAGSTYQALRDTGREPPHEDWSCIARGGR